MARARSYLWDHAAGQTLLGMGGKPAFRGAEVTPYNRGWQPEQRSGDAAHLEGWETLQGRVRWMRRNEGLTKKMVGKTSRRVAQLRLSSAARFAGEDAREFNAATDELWQDYLESTEVDAERRMNGAQMLVMLVSEQLTAGEVFAVRCDDPDENRLVPLCLQIFETEQLARHLDRRAGGGVNRIVRGIELDSQNRPVKYHFLKTHPFGVDGQTWETQEVEASRVLHLAMRLQPSDAHGTTHLAANVQPTKDRDFLIGAEASSAGFASLLAFAVYKKYGAGLGTGLDDGTGETQDPHGNNQFRLGRANVVNMSEGDKVEMFEPTRPGPNFQSFCDTLKALEAAGFELSVANGTGDYSKVTFHSAKMGASDDAEFYEFLVDSLVVAVWRPLHNWFVEQAVAMGLYSQVFDRDEQPVISAEMFVARRRSFLRTATIYPRRMVMDEHKENLSDAMAMQSGLMLRSEALAKRGHTLSGFLAARRRELEEEADLNFQTPGQSAAQANLDVQRSQDDALPKEDA